MQKRSVWNLFRANFGANHKVHNFTISTNELFFFMWKLPTAFMGMVYSQVTIDTWINLKIKINGAFVCRRSQNKNTTHTFRLLVSWHSAFYLFNFFKCYITIVLSTSDHFLKQLIKYDQFYLLTAKVENRNP